MVAKIHSVFHLLLLATISHARPSILRRGYASQATELLPDLKTLWTSEGGRPAVGNKQNSQYQTERPQDSASFYECFGPTLEKYPPKERWLSFQTLWEINEPEITTKNGGTQYNAMIKKAIEDIAKQSGVDKRLILTIMAQESHGKVDELCTGTDGKDCGLMQIGDSRRFDQSRPQESIKNMIYDGIYGTPSTTGFLQYFNAIQADVSWLPFTTPYWLGNPYAAMHIYNVGNITDPNLTRTNWIDEEGKETRNTYANDIASRLLGWNGWPEGCIKSRECGAPDNKEAFGFGDRECWK